MKEFFRRSLFGSHHSNRSRQQSLMDAKSRGEKWMRNRHFHEIKASPHKILFKCNYTNFTLETLGRHYLNQVVKHKIIIRGTKINPVWARDPHGTLCGVPTKSEKSHKPDWGPPHPGTDLSGRRVQVTKAKKMDQSRLKKPWEMRQLNLTSSLVLWTHKGHCWSEQGDATVHSGFDGSFGSTWMAWLMGMLCLQNGLTDEHAVATWPCLLLTKRTAALWGNVTTGLKLYSWMCEKC